MLYVLFIYIENKVFQFNYQNFVKLSINSLLFIKTSTFVETKPINFPAKLTHYI